MQRSPVDVPAAVDEHLERHLAQLTTELADHVPDVEPLLAEMRTAVTGGKRMRAALCVASFRAHRTDHRPAPDDDAVVAVGAALELFQAAALVHDDVMDASDTRRGRPAAHRSFATTHASHGWAGDGDAFGTAGAILLGDLLLVASERQMTAAVRGLEPAAAERARAVFDRMRTEVTVGQYLDVLAAHRPWGDDPHADERRARHVVRAKSARYSVEHPLTLGAVLAGADVAAIDRCGRVGLALGEAFQLRDDLLGVFGDPAVTGKPAGDDLREGKRTVLVARTLQTAAPDDARLVRESLGRPLTDDEVDAVRAAVVRAGAVTSVERLIDELAEPALAELTSAPLAEPARGELVAIARRLVDRAA